MLWGVATQRGARGALAAGAFEAWFWARQEAKQHQSLRWARRRALELTRRRDDDDPTPTRPAHA